jgi:hypothetical protein
MTSLKIAFQSPEQLNQRVYSTLFKISAFLEILAVRGTFRVQVLL